MNCKDRNLLAEYQLGALRPPETDRVAAHVAACPSCRAELEALARTAALLRPAPPADPPRDLWPAIQGRLRPRRARAPRPLVWRPALAAALAILLVMVGFWAIPGLQHTPLPFAANGDGDAVAQVQLAAAWDAPLADHAALGLAMLATMDEDTPPEAAN